MGNHLCIGGSLDGKWKWADSTVFRNPVLIGDGPRFYGELYDAQQFSGGEGLPVVTFWVFSELRGSAEASRRAWQLYDKAVNEAASRGVMPT